MGYLRFISMIIFAVILGACSSGDGNNSADAQTSNTNTVDTTGLVARVNGVEITQQAYDAEYSRRTVGTNAATEDALRRQVLNDLIEYELTRQGAPSLGINITDADVEAEIAEQRAIAGSDEAWADFLALNEYSEEAYFDVQRNALIALGVRNALIEPYLGEIEQVQARHILVQTEAEANEVLDRLENGEGFATLAAEYSLDRTTQNIGGNLGWFARNELYYANLEAIAFDLELNTIAGPVATRAGYHIIQTTDRATREVEPERLPILSQNLFNGWLSEQHRNATIETYVQW